MPHLTFSPHFSLVVEPVNVTAAAPVQAHVNHILVIDVSGSMSGDLPRMRLQLKNKLASLVKEGDTVTILWFSGKHQCGVLIEEAEIRSLTDLNPLHEAIDRHLRPVGLTGFKEPLEQAVQVIDRIAKHRPGSIFSLFFMTDGHDNQWGRAEILKAAEPLQSRVMNATIVEYGWYCNRDLLAKIAEVCGGNLLFSEGFPQYEVQFEHDLSRSLTGGKKVTLRLKQLPALDYAFTYGGDGTVTTFAVENEHQIVVPESVTSVCYFTELDLTSARARKGKDDLDDYPEQMYVGLATLSARMRANEIFAILAYLGDVALVNRFVNAFSKQDYNDFQAECLAMAFDPKRRFQQGRDVNCVPREDAYTVLHLLDELSSDAGNLIYPLHPAFDYQRIGAQQVAKEDSVKFEFADRDRGVPLDGIVMNATRPNVSLRVQYDGLVTLPAEASRFSKLPASLPTWIYRTYTIVKDGIVHTRQLPLSLTANTIAHLENSGVLPADSVTPGSLFVLDISGLPVINRQMVKSVKARYTFMRVWELEGLKADQKVFKHYRDEHAPKVSVGFAQIYGEDAAAWLKEIGLTDYSGFHPKTESVPMNDFYLAKTLDIGVRGVSSLPKVEDVVTKLDAGKPLTLRESLLSPAISRVRAFLASDTYRNAANPEALRATWLETESTTAISRARTLMLELAREKFAIVVGHVWFSDLAPGEESLTFDVNGVSLTVTAKLEEKEIGGKDSD